MSFLKNWTANLVASRGIQKLPPSPTNPRHELATLAAGCFWGLEKFFMKEFGAGILECRVGYTGGDLEFPTYEQVCSGKTGHAEAYRMEYDPTKVQYEDIIRFMFRMHDPTTQNRQGNDVGTQYRSAVFFHTPEQKLIAERVRDEVQQQYYPKQRISTEIVPAGVFWVAEDHHQKYLEKNPGGYCNHRLRW